MLGNLEISELRQDFQFEFIRGAITPLLEGEPEPIFPATSRTTSW